MSGRVAGSLVFLVPVVACSPLRPFASYSPGLRCCGVAVCFVSCGYRVISYSISDDVIADNRSMRYPPRACCFASSFPRYRTLVSYVSPSVPLRLLSRFRSRRLWRFVCFPRSPPPYPVVGADGWRCFVSLPLRACAFFSSAVCSLLASVAVFRSRSRCLPSCPRCRSYGFSFPLPALRQAER